VPVLAVRQADATVRVFLNACRHRGSLLCGPGLGRARHFTCPYHAWSYDRGGALVGVPGRESFGDLDAGEHGLRELSSAERAGFVFAVLTPGARLDLDAWLGDYTPVLEKLGLADMHLYAEREVIGPNWKVAYDGYVDAYHLDKLHRGTLGREFMGNVMAADAWGPHQRLAFPKRSLAALRGVPEESWPQPAGGAIGVVHTVFPHVSVAGGGDVPTLVSQLLPGPTADRSRTIQIHLTPEPLTSDAARSEMDAIVDFLLRVVRDEDYATGLGIQSTLAGGANESFLFGRNEPCNQIFHRWVERLQGRPA
jgi:nitrite reductase/ring-hydroxylating ferredoxin subunit